MCDRMSGRRGGFRKAALGKTKSNNSNNAKSASPSSSPGKQQRLDSFFMKSPQKEEKVKPLALEKKEVKPPIKRDTSASITDIKDDDMSVVKDVLTKRKREEKEEKEDEIEEADEEDLMVTEKNANLDDIIELSEREDDIKEPARKKLRLDSPQVSPPTSPSKRVVGVQAPQGFKLVKEAAEIIVLEKLLNKPKSVVCWSPIFSDNSTTTRPSRNSRHKLRTFSYLRAVAFLGEGETDGFFLHLDSSENAVNGDELYDRRLQVLLNFLTSELLKAKICYDCRAALKPILSHSPRLRPVNLFDPSVAAWLLATEAPSFDFEALLQRFLKTSAPRPDTFFGDASKSSVLGKEMRLLLRLYTTLDNQLTQYDLNAPLAEQEMRLTPILAQMELTGIGLDKASLGEKTKPLLLKLAAEVESRAEALMGFHIDLSSVTQVAAALYDRLGLVPDVKSGDRTTTGQRSTNEKVLTSLKKLHPLPDLILEHRKIMHAITNYIDGLPPYINSDGRIHTQWVTETATGRVASTEPNLQSMSRTALRFGSGDNVVEVNIRNSFVAKPGHIFIAADYSQIEMRIMAHVSKDKELISFFNSGQDIHALVAGKWKKKDISEVTKEERNVAKSLVYGVLYGRGAPSLADQLEVSVQEASKYQSTFLRAFPQLNDWISNCKKEASRTKEVHTLFGRRRLLGDTFASDWNRGLRQAVNTVMQGTAADLVKRAMIKMDDELLQRSMDAQLILQVHDELVYEVAVVDVEEFSVLLTASMESVLALDVPLTVNLKKGSTWGALV